MTERTLSRRPVAWDLRDAQLVTETDWMGRTSNA